MEKEKKQLSEEEVKEKKQKRKIQIIIMIIVVIMIPVLIYAGICIGKNNKEIEKLIQPENTEQENRQSIFYTDLETIKNEFNNNSSYISKRDNEAYSTINNFNSDTEGYSTYLTPTMRIITNTDFSLFLFTDFQIDYGYGGDSDKIIKAYEEMLIKSCIPELADNELDDLRIQLGTKNSIKDAYTSTSSENTIKEINYQDIKITRNFIADKKSNKVAYTLLMQKNSNNNNEKSSQDTDIATEEDTISEIDKEQEKFMVEPNSSQRTTTQSNSRTTSSTNKNTSTNQIKETTAKLNINLKQLIEKSKNNPELQEILKSNTIQVSVIVEESENTVKSQVFYGGAYIGETAAELPDTMIKTFDFKTEEGINPRSKVKIVIDNTSTMIREYTLYEQEMAFDKSGTYEIK